MSIRHVVAILRRELAGYFLGPMAFLILLAFQVLAWIDFWELLDKLARSTRNFSGMLDPLNLYVAASPSFWIGILVAVPALTMRLVAEERRSGTIEPLMTLPVTEVEVIVAKWLAGLALYLMILVPFAIYPPFLYFQGNYRFDPGPFLAMALGLTTAGMMFVAIGTLFSTLTKNQVVAAIWTFLAMFVLVFLSYIAQRYATTMYPRAAEVIRYLSVRDQVQEFAVGLFDLRYPALHLSATVFALFLAVVALRWRREA